MKLWTIKNACAGAELTALVLSASVDFLLDANVIDWCVWPVDIRANGLAIDMRPIYYLADWIANG